MIKQNVFFVVMVCFINIVYSHVLIAGEKVDNDEALMVMQVEPLGKPIFKVPTLTVAEIKQKILEEKNNKRKGVENIADIIADDSEQPLKKRRSALKREANFNHKRDGLPGETPNEFLSRIVGVESLVNAAPIKKQSNFCYWRDKKPGETPHEFMMRYVYEGS